MNNVIIRKATPNDLDVLLDFEQKLIAAERPFDLTLKTDPVHYYDLNKLLTASNVHLLVAEADHAIIASGYVRIDKSQPFLKHYEHAYLGFMYVKPEYRGQGINKRIMDSLKEWALSNHISEFRLEVYYDNISAIKAYEKFGFKRHIIEMRYNLVDE